MQVLFDGIVSGLVIALLSLSFTLVYLPTRVFFLALAGIYAFVPYAAWALFQAGWPLYAAAIAATLGGVVVSLLCELANHAPLERRRASENAHMLASLGIYIVIVQLVSIGWGNEPKVFSLGAEPALRIGELVLARPQSVAGVTSVLLLTLFFGWLRRSESGLQFQGLADNPVELALKGHNVACLRLLAFGLSGFLASAAALLTAFDVGFDPHRGLYALLLAVVAAMIGGRFSFVGPAVGGVILGVARSEISWSFPARWLEAFTFLMLIAFLLFRPHGLTGRNANGR